MIGNKVIGALGNVPKFRENGQEELEIGGKIALLQSTRILRSILETGRDLLSLRLLWKTCEIYKIKKNKKNKKETLSSFVAAQNKN